MDSYTFIDQNKCIWLIVDRTIVITPSLDQLDSMMISAEDEEHDGIKVFSIDRRR